MCSVNANVVIARRTLDRFHSGDLVRETPRPAVAARETSTSSVKALNGVARSVIDSLQSGAVFQGTVVSHATVGGVEMARVAIELPIIGQRQVLVQDDQELRVGEQVGIECVPNSAKPNRYVFRMANGTLSPAAGNGLAFKASRQ
jgi:hypothetical protein